ncbi:hypothetical protein D3C73_1213900 [compost metagenome]
MRIQQRSGLVHRQAPRAQHRAVFVDFRRADLQVHGVELIFHQVQGEVDLLVVELCLQSDLLVGYQPGQQRLNTSVAIDQQARHRVGLVQLRGLLHVLDEIQLVLGQKRIGVHDRTRS